MQVPSDELRPCESGDKLLTCWFETRLGVRYELPDMQKHNVDWLCKQFDERIDTITAVNVSSAVLILPKRILKRAGCGTFCFWETGCPTKINPEGLYQQD